MPFKVNTGFLPLPDHPLFVVMYLPTTGSRPVHWVLHCPAFAEEMNKSRKMVMDEARAFAEQGVGVLVPDLWGTGDSPGDFSEADWHTWRENLEHILFWLRQQGSHSVTLWGLRLGCLLALDVQNKWQTDWPKLVQLVFWQPVLNAQQSLTQFLRLRLASGLIASNTALQDGAVSQMRDIAEESGSTSVVKRPKAETVKDLRQRFAAGELLEVAGYTLSPSLVTQLDQISIGNLLPNAPVCWLEIKSQSGSQLSFSSLQVIEAWQQQSIEVDALSVVGDPFWTTQEIAHAQELINVTCESLITTELTQTAARPAIAGEVAGDHAELPYREQPMTPYKEKRSTASQDQTLEPYVEKRLTAYRETFASEPSPVVAGVSEEPLQFFCEGSHLYSMLHLPDGEPKQGIILIVGGPQYRVGSHRQFVQLARALAQAGIAVLRFDYRGMGDSEGGFLGFDDIDADIAAAVDAFERRLPQLQSTALWGLCDGATAAACYAAKDSRINGLVLLNPWVRSEAGEAKAYLRYYYWQRLRQPELWKKIGQGRFNIKDSLGSLLRALKRSTGAAHSAGAGNPDSCNLESRNPGARSPNTGNPGAHNPGSRKESPDNKPDLVTQMAQGLSHFTGNVLIVLSGADLTAAEFKDAMRSSRLLKKVVAQPQYQIEHLPESDHTFSRKAWKTRVEELTKEWMQSW